jgi:hypothetical protein
MRKKRCLRTKSRYLRRRRSNFQLKNVQVYGLDRKIWTRQ